MRLDDPAVVRGIAALRKALACEDGAPIFAEDVYTSVRKAVRDELLPAGPNAHRSAELRYLLDVARPVLLGALAPGTEVHTDRIVARLEAAIEDAAEL